MSFNVMDGFQGILLLFILLGLVVGIFRGFGKSVIRLFVVIAMAVVAFFVTPAISSAFLKTNISGLNIKIAGVEVNSIQSGIVSVLKKIKVVEELMGASPTFNTLIEKLPLVFLNVIFFIVTFFILKWISTIISFVLYKLILKKPKDDERKRLRILGGLVGAIQGVVVFAVLMIPVFGIVNIAKVASDNYQPGQSQESGSTFVSAGTSGPVSLMTETLAGEQDNNNENKIEEIKEKAEGYVKDFEKLEFVKVFKWVGLKGLSVKVFNNFTTVTVKKDKIVLVNEIKAVAKLASKVDTFADISTSPDEEMLDNLRFVINTAFESKIFSKVVGEVVPYVAEEWGDETSPTAFGIKKPKVPKEILNLFDAALEQMSVATSSSIKKDLLQIVEVMDVASQNGLLDAVVKGKEETAMNKFADEVVLVNVIDAMIESQTLKALLPEVMQTGLNFVFPVIGVPENEEELKQKFFSEVAFAIKSTPALSETSTSEEIEAAKTEFIGRMRAVLDRFEFDFDGVEEADLDSWLEDLATSAISFFGQELQNEQIEEHFRNNELVSGERTINFNDMQNSKRKTAEDLQIDRGLSDEQWQDEKTVIAKIFANIAGTFNSLKGAEAGSEIDKIDFSMLGAAFDWLRKSELFDDRAPVPDRAPVDERLSFNLVAAMLRSDMMKNINVTEPFIQNFHDNWDNEDFSFEQSLKTLQSAVYIMNAFNTSGDISPYDMEVLLEGLTGGLGEVISGFITQEILESAGIDSSLSSAIVDIVSALSEQELGDDVDSAAEADAMNGLLQVMNSSNEGDFDEENIENVINDLMNSTVLLGAIVDANEGDAFGIAAAVEGDTDAQTEIEASLASQLADINEMDDGPAKVAAKLKLDKVASLFGYRFNSVSGAYELPA